MENYTIEQFLEDVRKEARMLKQSATEEELSRLSLNDLQPDFGGYCIYGQMTGSCFSMRASELIFKCCPRFFNGRRFDDFKLDAQIAMQSANGATIKGVKTVKDFYEHRICFGDEWYFSVIESYIMIPAAKNAELIAYLKGETDTLEL